ncbi:MAG: AAA family ATPase [Holosporales bacterium]|jgi:DNA repair protein RecN (Recombination protein N)|nr:AAA family ATPase [Holosporales bacterium]
MLLQLSIRNFVLIERADLSFSSGFTVVTGETGSGKSLLLSAIAFALGGKLEDPPVGPFAEEASVTLEFSSPGGERSAPIASWIEQAGIGDTELLFRRTLTREGKSRAFLNDRVISQGFLRKLAPFLLEFHGQFSQLWEAADHEVLLDRFAGIDAAEMARLFSQWKETQRQLSKLEEKAVQQEEERTLLARVLSDFERIHPEEGEESRLLQAKSSLKHQRATQEALEQLRSLLGEQTGATFRQVQKILMREEMHSFSDLLPLLEQAWTSVEAILGPLEARAQALSSAEQSPEAIEERLFTLRDFARQQNTVPEMLGDLWAELKARAEHLAPISTTALEEQCSREHAAYEAAAGKASVRRRQAAGFLTSEVNGHLQDLRFIGAEFRVEIAPCETPGPKGQDAITFLVRTNPQGALRPLERGGSGGELARFSLALYTALARSLDITTLIFDEIDTGTSGAVASSIGSKLRSLAEKHLQVLTVTHSHQVAAVAHHHIGVRKETRGQETRTLIEQLNSDKKIETLAQMLSAEKITEAARQVARTLVEKG